MSNSYCKVLKLQNGQGFKKAFPSRENSNVSWVNEQQEVLMSIKRKWRPVTLFVGALEGAASSVENATKASQNINHKTTRWWSNPSSESLTKGIKTSNEYCGVQFSTNYIYQMGSGVNDHWYIRQVLTIMHGLILNSPPSYLNFSGSTF